MFFRNFQKYFTGTIATSAIVFAGSTFAQDTPVYRGGQAELPAVIDAENNILYRDVILEDNGDGNLAITGGVEADLTEIEDVEVNVSDDFPVIVTLTIAAVFPDACRNATVHQQRIEEEIFVLIANEEPPEGIACAQVLTEGVIVVTVNTTNLAAGEYTVWVNDQEAVSFTLDEDNIEPEVS
ncbi:MAG: hypothetical protein WDZ76_04020 [Pseudohongiellaceae bacterium]